MSVVKSDCSGQMIKKLANICFSLLAQLKSLAKKRLSKFESRRKHEWYLHHQRNNSQRQPGKVQRVINGASKLHEISLIILFFFAFPNLLQSLLYFSIPFRQQTLTIWADIEGMFCRFEIALRPTIFAVSVVYQYTGQKFGALDSPTCAN